MNSNGYQEVFQLKKDEKESKCSKNLVKILSVPTLLVFIVFIAYFGLIPVQMELHSLIIIGVIYLIFTLFVRHNASYSTCIFHHHKHYLVSEISRYLTDNIIVLMGETKAIGSIDKFFDKFSQMLRNDNYASVAAGTFPTLGILGTFISIALSMPDFGASSSDALNSELTKLLGGVGTAFYASIYGIFLSLWWVFFEKKGFSFIEKELQEMREEFETKLWSDEELKRATFIEQKELNLELQKAIKESLSLEFIQKLNETATKQTSLLFKTLNADRIFHEEQRKTYTEIVNKFATITDMQEVVAQKLDQTVVLANNSYAHLGENVDKLKSLSQLFQANYDAITEQNESSKHVAQALEKVVATFGTQTENITHLLESTTTSLVNTQSSIYGASDKLLSVAESMDSLVDSLGISTDKQILVSEKLDKSIHSANISYETLSHNVSELESMSKTFLLSNESSKQIVEILAASLAQLNAETTKVNSFFSGFSTDLGDAQNSIGSMSNKLLDLSNGMLNLLDGMNDTYNETTKKQMKAVNKSLASLESLYSKFHNNIGNTLQSFEQNATNIKNGNELMIGSVKSFEESLEDFNIELIAKLDTLISATQKAQNRQI